MTHYFLENQPEYVQKRALDGKLSGPEFVGQGCTYSVGSDSYGYYVAEILRSGRLVALVPADAEYATSWTAGDMTCTMPADKVVKAAVAGPSRPNSEFKYVMKYGRKWYWCAVVDGEIRRCCGRHGCAGLSWNGSFQYLDPSF